MDQVSLGVPLLLDSAPRVTSLHIPGPTDSSGGLPGNPVPLSLWTSYIITPNPLPVYQVGGAGVITEATLEGSCADEP